MNEQHESRGEVTVHSSLQRVENDPSQIDLLGMIEKRNKLLERVLEYAIKATHPEQWTDLGGSPWPSAAACESMARRCGVKWHGLQHNKRMSSDERGDFYLYECTGTVELPSGFDSIEALGTCSSRDTFLGTETNAGRELSEIDEGSIMKAAFSNFIVNGVTRLLGVRRLSWARLAELGIGRDGMSKVEFNAGSKGGGQKAAGADIEVKFGKAKGQTIGQLSDEHLAWYLEVFEKDLADPEKAKYRANTEKQIAAVKAQQAARASKPRTNGEPTPYEKCFALGKEHGLDEAAINAAVKEATGRGKPSEVVADDVAKFSAHLKAKAAA